MTSAGEQDDLPAIRQGLADRARELFWRLYDKPTTARGHQLRWGRKGSLVLYLRGRNGPRWYCYETRQGGDMLGAIQHALHLDFAGALDWARDFLGLPAREDRRREPRRQAEPPRAKPAADYAAEQTAKAERAGDLAAAAQPIGGTLADIYLRRHRGIEAEAWPDALGFADAGTVRRCTGWKWWRWSALVVRATDAAGTVTGVQLIALKDDGSAAPHWAHGGKLKMSFGTLSDAAVRLPGDDRALLLAEGPETALSCWWATGIETWCNLGSIARAPLTGIPINRLIVVCADDDPRKAQSNKALRDAIRGWRRQGRRVALVKPHTLTKRDKSDFNDTLRVEGREAVRARIMAAIDAGPAATAKMLDVDEARGKTDKLIGKAVDELLHPDQFDNPYVQYARGALAPFKVLWVGTGIGKTAIAIRRAVAAAASGAKIIYLVPTHRLGGELIDRIKREGLEQGVEASVDIWRGRTADRQLDEPGEKMCSEPDVMAAAQAAKADPDDVCKICPAAADCPYLAQFDRAAQIWIAAHDMLWHEMPKPLKGADLVIIDEGFALRGLTGFTGKPALITEAELDAVPLVGVALEADLRRLLMPHRHQLVAALRDHPDGGLTHERLTAAGLTVEGAVAARKLEWSRKVQVNLAGLSWRSAKKVLMEAAEQNRLIPRFASLWHAVEDVLSAGGAAVSGRAIIGNHKLDGSTVRAVRLFGAEEISAEWRRTPTLHIDATVDMPLLRLRVPHAELIGEIEAATPHMDVVQYPDRAFGKLALRNERFLFKVWDWCVAYASRAGGEWGIVLPLEAEIAILAAREVPDFIKLHHFGALRGLDKLRDVRGLILVGRPMASPGEVERMAGAISGRAVEAAVVDDWYPAAVEQIHARDGAVASVEVDHHPDALAEAVRAAITEGEQMQTIGRPRGVNRTADNPVEIVLLTNIPVPGLAVDELRQWEGPTIDDEIFARFGAALESAGDAAKVAGVKTDVVKDHPPSTLCQATYQLSGPGRSRQLAVYDRRRIPDIEVWLTERLGPLASVAEVDPDLAPEAEGPAAEPEVAYPGVGDHPVEPAVEPAIGPGEAEPVAAAATASPARKCEWFVFRADDRSLRHCGREIEHGLTWCPEHIQWSAQITSSSRPVSTGAPLPPLGAASNDAGADQPGHFRLGA